VPDITDSKQAEAALRRERPMPDGIIKTTDAMLALLDPELNFVWVNPAYAETCRMRPQEMIGKNCFALSPDAENEAVFRRVRDTGEEVFCKDKPFELPDQPGRGVTCWDWSLTPVKSANGAVTGLVFSLRETTRYKQAEQALRESEARFRQLADSMPQLVWTADSRGHVDYCNRRGAVYQGISWSPDGTGVWRPALHPDDYRRTVDAWHSAVARGEIYQCEHRVRMTDGTWRWHLSRASPVKAEPHRIVKWYGTATDIHDLKRAEDALRGADRRKDEFLATLAHELRNPLAAIHNAVDILKLQRSADPTVQAAGDILDRQSRQLMCLVDDLLDVNRIRRGKLQLRRERVALSAVLAQALEGASPCILAAGQELSVSLPPRPAWLDADPVRLAQVFVNLLTNASKYTEKGGRIRLSAKQTRTEVAVTVEDTGIGMAPEDLAVIFEMFRQLPSSAQQPQAGLGIGLALARSLVERHGGRIEAHSEGVGRGSAFCVHLPVLAHDSTLSPSHPDEANDCRFQCT
jgi:PAS domain S-box-containing protein